uniref:Putative ribonuclease p protein n=1 Tax=Ornithodoros turicata TaxID=34597 RepID=A0A2R5LHC9_9ACAR
MENYTKGEVIQHVVGLSDLPFKDLQENCVHMKVNANCKIRNILGFAITAFKDATKKQMVFSGSGHGINKMITCVEIMKRKFKNLHQLNKICYQKIDEIWEPKTEDLDKLKVEREIPAMHILLSKEPLDTNEFGYQGPGSASISRSNEPRRDRQQRQKRPRQNRPTEQRQRKKKEPQTN